MKTTEQLIWIAGILHFCILAASFQVPKVLNWKESLAGLTPFLRRLFWVYGVFIVLMIVGFGVISVCHAGALAAGTPLARTVCGFIAVFWGVRLIVQFTVFGKPDFIRGWYLNTGYHGLTLMFIVFTAIYTSAAFFARP